ncbi:MAG: class SAM-dependent methyltransferase, partial [Clostridiales bacterium]|nr:class SAM-dependent methyltransferase [Clostridiales bacterium]
MDIAKWIDENLKPESCTSDKFIYNDLDSQSCYSLPVIYVPFDSSNKSHWADRGCLYDFLYSVNGEGKKILDFGPGDGWPSLIIAPFVEEVIGLDSSPRRVEVCSENAKRLNISNARFLSYVPGTNVPFEDNTFDGIVASSSIEQTPNPREIIKELYRVLKPGGKLRVFYEALNEYKDGEENDIWINPIDDNSCMLIIYFRNIEEEYADQYALTLNISSENLTEILSSNGKPSYRDITIEFLENIKAKITSSRICRTIHPTGKTYSAWMRSAGFKEVHPTHSGRVVAGRLYDT